MQATKLWGYSGCHKTDGISHKVVYKTGTTITVRTLPEASPNMMTTVKNTQNTSYIRY